MESTLKIAGEKFFRNQFLPALAFKESYIASVRSKGVGGITGFLRGSFLAGSLLKAANTLISINMIQTSVLNRAGVLFMIV
jgi:hypothetical protein